MNIYPAVDIFKGQVVRLKQGRADDVTVYGQPLEMAERWYKAGATWLHVVDLDGAFEGTPANHGVIAKIAQTLPKLKVQVGGGIRSMAVVENLFAAGVQRVVLGTSAVNDPKFTSEALNRYGERIAIGIDARDGFAKVSGWTEDSRIGAIDLARTLEGQGARLVIYTDISRDGVLVGPNVDSLLQMIDGTELRVIASGGVSKLEDVRTLVAIGHARLDGVIIGKALYEQLLTLEEALEVAQC
ncbi:MAG TPA: 1-(5-phosphoribosyl)-5-[(5-phosphoribosylamino)methylideneamino]imidazole-4-carboxamide isomerase [Terriglobia bacterium]|nr:1-(5-phosphoribosyl)-5-[(5-phosphoribosylamino)methylideneamino]imidazole-4-carboxamide isomerase [Terriglobia bacterium]